MAKCILIVWMDLKAIKSVSSHLGYPVVLFLSLSDFAQSLCQSLSQFVPKLMTDSYLILTPPKVNLFEISHV